uniref:Uncharacterized protein n=1 Tax=Knipowitschia caucasica TaxID=637954 RepID=A0AAV2MH99_KNICA
MSSGKHFICIPRRTQPHSPVWICDTPHGDPTMPFASSFSAKLFHKVRRWEVQSGEASLNYLCSYSTLIKRSLPLSRPPCTNSPQAQWTAELCDITGDISVESVVQSVLAGAALLQRATAHWLKNTASASLPPPAPLPPGPSAPLPPCPPASLPPCPPASLPPCPPAPLPPCPSAPLPPCLSAPLPPCLSAPLPPCPSAPLPLCPPAPLPLCPPAPCTALPPP